MTNSDIFFQGSAIHSIGVRAQNLLIGSASTNITIQSRRYSMAGQILQVQPTGPGLRRLQFSLRRFDSRFQLGGGGGIRALPSALFSLRRFYSYLAYRAGITAYLFSSVYGDFNPFFSLRDRITARPLSSVYGDFTHIFILQIRDYESSTLIQSTAVSGITAHQVSSTTVLLLASAHRTGITAHPLSSVHGAFTLKLHW
jgi:hypothetical protein